MTVLKRISVACLIVGLFVPLDAARVGSKSGGPQAQQAAASLPLTVPNKADSLKFAVLGDFGTGSKEQYQLAAIMTRVHDQYPFNLVTLVGDNLYGSERPQDFKKKFEDP